MLARFLPLAICMSIASSLLSDATAAELVGFAPVTPAAGPCAAKITESDGERASPAVSSETSSPVSISANLGTGKMFGHTQYTIRFSSFSEMFGSEVVGESKLDFPLEVLLAELDLSVQNTSKARRFWVIALGLRKSVYDPVGIMEDSDWLSIPDIGFHEKMIFTQSDAEADVFVLDLRGGMELLRSQSVTVKGMLGYMYQDFSYKIFGASGWGLDLGYERVYFDLCEGVNVGDYEVSYSLPYLGIAASLGPSRWLTVDAQLTVSPIAFANDRDDHILRNKGAEGECRGTSFAGGVNATWTIASSEGGPSWSLRLGGECLRTDTDGEQVQFFYGDDPSFEGDETGLRLEGIDLEISSRQYRVMLQFGLRF